MTILLIMIAVAIYLLLLPGLIANKKGRSFWGFFLLGFVITPIFAAILAACAEPDHCELKHRSDNWKWRTR